MSAAWTEREIELLRPLAAVAKAPRGAVAAVARQIGRPPETVWSRVVAMRRTGGDGPAPGARGTFTNGGPWRAAELAALLPYVRTTRRAPRGTLPRLAAALGRTVQAVSEKLHLMRTWTDEELAAATGSPAPMREAPRADGSGQRLDVSSLTLPAAVQALAPRAVSSAAGAAPAAPAVRSAEGVERRCCKCRVVFRAPSRFRFRCDGCLQLHASWTGYDA